MEKKRESHENATSTRSLLAAVKEGGARFSKLSLPFSVRRLGPHPFGGRSSRVAVPSLQFLHPAHFERGNYREDYTLLLLPSFFTLSTWGFMYMMLWVATDVMCGGLVVRTHTTTICDTVYSGCLPVCAGCEPAYPPQKNMK